MCLCVCLRVCVRQHDPLAACNCTPPYSGVNGVAARDDLSDPNGTYPFDTLSCGTLVAIDSKVTSSALFSSGLACLAISGPTYDQQPVFQFSTSLFANLTHVGVPDRFDFPWQLMEWAPLL